MGRTKIKICGVANPRDVNFISMLDVDYIGFNLVTGTPRAVSEAALVKLVEIVPPYISSVAVMMNPELKDVKRIIKKTGMRYFQFHGNESVEFISEVKALGVKTIKAFRPREEAEIEKAAAYLEAADYFLLDSYCKQQPGGSGVVFSKELAMKMKELGKPLFLAGGLTADNVSDAVIETEPFAVDTSSGVEKTPRSKDIEKVRGFIRAARGA